MRVVEISGKPTLCLFALKYIPMGSELFYAYGVDNLPWKRLETEHTNNFTTVPKKKELTIGTSSEELVYGNAHSDSRQSPKISSVIVAHKTNDCFKDNSCSMSNMTIEKALSEPLVNHNDIVLPESNLSLSTPSFVTSDHEKSTLPSITNLSNPTFVKIVDTNLIRCQNMHISTPSSTSVLLNGQFVTYVLTNSYSINTSNKL